ncbi:hypothetical protein DEU56DRAFT_782498 [Suillus clintonianus]|uniref:uncharacterized protein n=1 Tax=Suillus clintonianus TaxID=1904413 RepID=UPI001B86F813|nr:uncharacterized protein DEU56DRAFT_782498 [Suillus clintonianus]KAG2148843.1 hypothetical protein DEU56DRAFT_782498 [Suillus clintonianus]
MIELYDKYLVTSTFTCPGYYIYLSNKSGERIALALTRNSVVWWTDSQPALTRKAVDNDGRFCYSPLYTLKQRGTKWFRRKYPGEEETDGMWLDYIPPWDPLDEDGNELQKETDEMRARKFIDLIFQASSKWANWNPDIEIKVGDYGTINRESGRLIVEGNIYDAVFQESLKQQGLMINLSDVSCQPTNLGAVEKDIIMLSMGVEKGNFAFKPEASSPNLDSASVKAEFQFQEGKRGAALVMHKPQEEFIPLDGVLGIIHEANQLKDKYVVDSTLKCPAYYLYLSNKSGEKISLALAASPAGVATDGEASVDWWTDAQAGFLRQAFDKAGQHRYTPIYTLKRMLQPLVHGAEEHLAEDDPRPDCIPPWDPLDEDGNELHEETDDMRARKFTDLIRQTSSKWANWDPAIEIKVGDYGTINRECGELEVQGNIYDAAFQESLNQQGLMIDLSDASCQPVRGTVEEDIVMSSTVTKEDDSSLKPEEYVFSQLLLLAHYYLNVLIDQPLHLCEGQVPVPGGQARRPPHDA